MKKILSVILVASLLLASCLLMASCGENQNTLKMATNASFPPYEFVADDGSYAGIDVEICQYIADQLGMKLEIYDVSFSSIIGGIETGKYDIGAAGMTVTETRLKSVNFSTSYAKGVQVVIVPENSEYTSVDDFFILDAEGNWTAVKEGVKIGVQQGTTGDIYCSDTVENFGFGEENVISYKTGNEAVLALKAGKVTAVIIDNEPAKEYVKANGGLVILDSTYADEDYAIAIGKENTELQEKINKVLAEMMENGKLNEIVSKYISAK